MEFVYFERKVGIYVEGKFMSLNERECPKALGEAIVSRLNELDLPYHKDSYPTLLKFAIAITHKIPVSELDQYLNDCHY